MSASASARWRPFAKTANRTFYGAVQDDWRVAWAMVMAVKMRAAQHRRDLVCWGIERVITRRAQE